MYRRYPELSELQLRDQILNMIRTGSSLEALQPYVDELCARAISASRP